MDKRVFNGGARVGSGRKSKPKEQKLIESLDGIINQKKAIEVLKELVYGGDIRAMQLYLGYRYGKPKESVDITQFIEQPLFLDVSENYIDAEVTEVIEEN